MVRQELQLVFPAAGNLRETTEWQYARQSGRIGDSIDVVVVATCLP
jgi:hypothetical protein